MKKRITFTMDEKTINDLRELSKETLIPQARLVERALIEMIANHKEGK